MSDVQRPVIVGLRMSQEERDRLDAIAARAGRTPSDVLRMLLALVDAEQITNGLPRTALPAWRARKLVSQEVRRGAGDGKQTTD